MSNTCTLMTANAGCGKTWTLANRCIGWMVAQRRATGHAQPSGLVAATFTRKAAGEILQRLLSHLSEAALNPAKIEEFRAGFGLDQPPTSEELIGVLEDVATSLHRLQFGTLDGFYNRIAATFSGEIGMPTGWTIGDRPILAMLERRALDGRLNRCDEPTLQMLVTVAEQDIIKSQVNNLLPIIFGDKGSGGLLSMWRQTFLDAGDRSPWQLLLELSPDALSPGARRHSAEEITAACVSLMKAPVPLYQKDCESGKKGDEKERWLDNREEVLELVHANKWKQVLLNKMVYRVAFGQKFDSAMAEPAFADAMAPLIAHARRYLVDVARRRMATWGLLLKDLDLIMEDIQREDGVYSFADVTYHLARANLLLHRDRDWLQFRLDSELRDLALDEFQDTSVSQFAVIKPIIAEILAGAGSHELPRQLLVVADPKQSIYGWRGGTPSLLQKLREMGGDRLEQSVLGRSYRSGPEVISFVNDVFGTLKKNAALRSKAQPAIPPNTLSRCGLPEADTTTDPIIRALDNWHFEPHDTARSDIKGAVIGWRLYDQGLKKTAKLLLEALASRMVEIVRDRLPRAHSIGILVRTNKQVAAIVAALREAGIDASQEGRGAIADNPAIRGLLALLRLGDHPGNREAAYDVSHSPLGPLVDLDPLENIDPQQQGDELARVSRVIRRRVIDEGLEGLLVSLATELEPDMDARDRQAFRHCIDLAATWQPSDITRLDDFVHHVETPSAGEPSGAAVCVMTIYKAKGLEFDEVILPLLDKLMVSSRSAECVPWSPSEREPVAVVVPQMAKGLRPYLPLLEVVEQRQMELTLGDELSLQYVAVTRARRVLHLVFQPTGKPANHKLTAGTLIRSALPDLDEAVENGEEDERGRVWVRADDNWDDPPLETVRPVEAIQGARPIRIAARQEDHEVGSAGSITPSASNEGALVDRFRVWNTRARRRGTLLHELFRSIDWLEDGRPDAAAIEAAFARTAVATGGPASPGEREEALQVFEAALDDAAVSNRLCRAAYADHGADTLEVLQEWPILEYLDGELVRGRIDRMVVGRRGDEIVFIEIVDFKSGRVDDDQAASEAVEHYRPQVNFYIESVLVHFGLDPATVTGRLLFIESGRDLPCTPCPAVPSSS